MLMSSYVSTKLCSSIKNKLPKMTKEARMKKLNKVCQLKEGGSEKDESHPEKFKTNNFILIEFIIYAKY